MCLDHSRGVRRDVLLPLRVHASVFAMVTGFVDDALKIRSQVSTLQLVSSMLRFSFVQKRIRWGGKLCMLFIAKDIRISRAKFHCNRLTTVQDIQDYARLVFGTHCILYWGWSWSNALRQQRGCRVVLLTCGAVFEVRQTLATESRWFGCVRAGCNYIPSTTFSQSTADRNVCT